MHRRWFTRAAFAIAILCASGCSRSHYRIQADREVNAIVDNKAASAVLAGARPGEYRIDIDPRSRMYDPSNPDCPPMPPDDPVSAQLMQCVDCKPGSPCWNHLGKTPYVENPSWEDYLPRDAEGNVVLDLRGAVRLALLHAPDYQESLETLYLSGLDVSFERFRFDAQFFGGSSIFFTSLGREAGGGDSQSILEVQPSRTGNRWRVEKLTATGGELVVGLANSLIWQFSGPDNYTSNTLIDFNFVQPLLRAGGRTVVLERLTVSERALLANVRQMERYRRGFYLNVVTGRPEGQGPNRRGGIFGGSGLEGFSGVGAGGFGQIGGVGGQGQGQQQGFTGGAGAQGAGGYLGLLQSAQVIRNQYANIAGLRDSVEQLQAAYDAGRLDRFQVDLARQALYNAQSSLLNTVLQYENNLDNFKTQNGLPPDLPVRLTDPLLDRFSLLDPELSVLQTRIADVLTVVREGTGASLPGNIPPPAQPGAPPPVGQQVIAPITEQELARLVAESQDLRRGSEQQFAIALADMERLDQVLPVRRETLLQLAMRPEVSEMNLDPELFSVQVLEQRVATLREELAQLGQRLQTAFARIEAVASDRQATEARRAALTGALTQLSGEMLELSLLQARARLDAITFDPLELTPEEGFCIASHYRPDWMNARAAVVDSWRLIAFNANDLQSDLDVVFSGDIGNVGDNPFRLRSTNGRLRAGLEFDAPLTRVSERNNYRQSLIEYQQARRDYYSFRDRVHQGIRNTLRQLRVDDLNFELRRAAVHVAITQVDVTRLRLSEPARPAQTSAPGQPTQPGGGAVFGATVARDLVNALIDLLNVQNDFLSVWVDQEVQRIQLDHDLGIMELDADGLRIEHQQPLRTYLENLPPTVPYCELPNFCALPREDATTTAPHAQPQPAPAQSIQFRPAEMILGPQLSPTPADGASRPATVVPAGQLPLVGPGVVTASGTAESPAAAANQASFSGLEGAEALAAPRRLPLPEATGK
jgi:outer membrane protein TolC